MDDAQSTCACTAAAIDIEMNMKKQQQHEVRVERVLAFQRQKLPSRSRAYFHLCKIPPSCQCNLFSLGEACFQLLCEDLVHVIRTSTTASSNEEEMQQQRLCNRDSELFFGLVCLLLRWENSLNISHDWTASLTSNYSQLLTSHESPSIHPLESLSCSSEGRKEDSRPTPRTLSCARLNLNQIKASG